MRAIQKSLHVQQSHHRLSTISMRSSSSRRLDQSRKYFPNLGSENYYSKATSIKSPSSDDGHETRNNLKYTCHLNLKEGISNLKASYIPDFGYADQLNFSIVSQSPSRAITPEDSVNCKYRLTSGNWKILANQILLPFAPKYSLMLRTLQQSERRARQKEKLKQMKICEAKKTFKRIATKINIITPLNSAAQKTEKQKQLKELQDMIFRSKSQPTISQKQRDASLKFVEKNLEKLRKINEMKSDMKSIKDNQKKSEKNIVSLFQKLSPKKKQFQSKPNLCLNGEFERKQSPGSKDSLPFSPYHNKRVKITRKDLGLAQTCENLISIEHPNFLLDTCQLNKNRGRFSVQELPKNISTFYPRSLKSLERIDSPELLLPNQDKSPKLRKMSSKKKIQIRIQNCISKLYPQNLEKICSERKRNVSKLEHSRSVSLSSDGSITRLVSEQESWLKPNKNHLKPVRRTSTRNKDLLTTKTSSYKTHDFTQMSTLKSTDIETRVPSHIVERSKLKKKIKILPPIDILEQQRLMEKAIESARMSYAPTPPVMDNQRVSNHQIKEPMEVNEEGGHWFKKGKVITSQSLFCRS